MLTKMGARLRFLWAYITQPNGLRAYVLSILLLLLVGFLIGGVNDFLHRDRYHIDTATVLLDELPWYAKLGFSTADADGFSPTDPGVIRATPFPIDLNKLFQIPPGNATNQFALMTTFTVPEELLSVPLAIMVPELGENWAVMLNGRLIRNELHLNGDGSIAIYRSVQRTIIYLPESVLQSGENVLVFWMIGNAPATRFYTGMVPGFTMNHGFILGTASNLNRLRVRSTAISYFQIGVYFFFGVFMFLFYRRRKEMFTLLYGIFLWIFAGYAFFSSVLVFEVIHNTALIIRLMDCDIILCIPIIGMSFWHFLRPGQPLKFDLIFINALCVIAALLVCFLPYRLVGTIFRVMSFLLIGVLLHLFAIVVNSARKGVEHSRDFFLAAVIIAIIAVWSIADMIWFRTGIDLISWAPLLLSIVFVVVFINTYWEMGMELVDKNIQLQRNAAQLEDMVARRTEELTDAKAELEQQLHEIQHLQLTLSEQAMRDPLTGLYNRRYMEESLKKEFARALRKDYPVSLVMMDIDHFKKLNDTYTHAAGDQVLQVLGNVLSSHVRVDDYAIRYGGEEFLIIFPQTPYAHACIRANQLRELIERIEVKYNNVVLKITISAGVACFPDHGNTPEAVVSCADIAMYKAKQLGRNRVEVYLNGEGMKAENTAETAKHAADLSVYPDDRKTKFFE